MSTQRYIDVTFGPLVLRGRLLADRSPVASESFWSRLPFEGSVLLDEWSGFVARMRSTAVLSGGAADAEVAFPYPGLIAWEPRSGDLAVCFGQGRLQDGLGPLVTHSLVELGGDLSELDRLCRRLQYDGALPFRIAESADQVSELDPAPIESAERVAITLGYATGTAALLTSTSPVTARSFGDALPLRGTATNTFLSGPLTRFRGGEEGGAQEIALETGPEDAVQMILWPGYIYYRPVAPRGLRIAFREATIMAEIGKGGTPVIPVARVTDGLDDLRLVAEGLRVSGSVGLTLEKLR